MITLDTLKDRVYPLHLSTEQDEEIKDIIETAYRIGWENGHDETIKNYTPIIDTMKFYLLTAGDQYYPTSGDGDWLF